MNYTCELYIGIGLSTLKTGKIQTKTAERKANMILLKYAKNLSFFLTDFFRKVRKGKSAT